MTQKEGSYKRFKIDMHTHIIPEKMPDFSKKFGYEGFINLLHHKPGAARMMKSDRFFREIQSNCWDAELRIEDYRKHSTQYQVVCTIPVMFSYWAKPEDCLDLSMFLNDHIAEICKEHSNHYLGLATVPMQDVDLAIQELTRCKEELGLKGVQIGSNINNHNLSKPRFFPFFEACESLGMAVLVHPWEMMGSEHLDKYWLPWLVGMPAETSRAVCSMIFGGVLERYPNLRVNFAHAGGAFLPTLGRITHGFNCRPDLVAVDNNVSPDHYLGKFWVDCITHDPKLLLYVIDMIGSEKITLGSDYPFPLGDLEIGQFIEEMKLPKSDKENIFFKSTLQWLDMTEDELQIN